MTLCPLLLPGMKSWILAQIPQGQCWGHLRELSWPQGLDKGTKTTLSPPQTICRTGAEYRVSGKAIKSPVILMSQSPFSIPIQADLSSSGDIVTELSPCHRALGHQP